MFGIFTPKIKVEIVHENGDSYIKTCKISGNTVVITPGKRGRGGSGWQPTFKNSWIISEKGRKLFFPYTKKRLIVRKGAPSCVNMFPEQELKKVPLWNRESEEKLFEANVIKAAGASIQKIKIPFMVYLLMALTFGVAFLNFLISTGRVRI